LPDGLPDVASFDYDLLTPVLRRRVEDIAERMQCPPDFPAVALIVSLASVIGRRAAIAPKEHDDWTVIPNLWGSVVGRPGVMKSPPLAEIMKPLQHLQVKALEAFDQEMSERGATSLVREQNTKVTKARIQKLLKEKKTALADQEARALLDCGDSEPVCRRYVVNDSTVEKLGEILNENPCGVLLFRDELNGFFRTLEKNGRESDRAFYLECWNGDGAFTYDRIGRGTLHIESACVSILGGIQPGPMTDIVRNLAGSGDDGLLQRFQLLVWPDPSRSWRNIDRRPNLDAKRDVQSVIEDLNRLGGEFIPPYRFSPDAQQLFNVWRGALELRLRDGSMHALLEAHLSKYRSLVPSLSVILHLTETDAGPVNLIALERAIAWAEYLESHARRVYAPALAPDVDAALALAKRIQAGDVGETFRLRDIYRNGWSGLSTKDQAAAAVAVLCDFDWLHERVKDTGGRPTNEYICNPSLREVQAE
jgi:putative DNA primase/helicase